MTAFPRCWPLSRPFWNRPKASEFNPPNRHGNRLGSALSSRVRCREDGHPKDYYEALQKGSRGLEIDPWLGWFGEIVLQAQDRTLAEVHFLIAKARTFDRLRGQINDRQEKALLRMFAEGTDGFKGGLSAHNYQTITGAAPATTTRDLARLVELGALRRTGEHRHARYHLMLDKA